jgi:hypothetical protein
MPAGTYARLPVEKTRLEKTRRYKGCRHMAVCTTPRLALISRQDTPRATGSQFLESKGTLSLKVLGPGKPGRVVNIRSPKCTIGSGTGCTLRLRAAGIDSLHCWVLRGTAGTVIRRLNGAATLNGTHFDEALLSVGDRLSIGPVHLEVIDCNATPFQSQITVEASTQFQNEIQSLQSKLDDSQLQIKRLEVESRQGFESSIMAAERADQLRDALAAANQQLEEICNELNAAQDTILAQKSELTVQTAKLATEQSGAQRASDTISRLEAELATATTQRDELQAALNAAQDQAAKDRETHQQACEQLEQRCQQLAADLQSTRCELPINSAAVTAVFDQSAFQESSSEKLQEFQRLIAEKDVEIVELRRQLDNQANLQQRYEQLAGECDGKGSELAQAQEQIDQLSSRLQEMQQLVQKYEHAVHQQSDLAERESKLLETTQTLENERAALAAEAAQLQQAKGEFEQQKVQIDDANRQLAAEQANLRELAERTAGEQKEQVHNDAILQVREAELATRIAELDRLFEQLVDQRASLAIRSDDIERLQNDCLQRAQELEGQALELKTLQEQFRGDASPRLNHATADQVIPEETFANYQTAESAEPQNYDNTSNDNTSNDNSDDQSDPHDSGVDSVLSRLVQAGIWRQDEQDETTAAVEPATSEPEEPTYSSTISFESVAPSFENAPRSPQPGSSSGGDEESIESYMDRLMKRVRGDSPLTQSSWKSSATPVESILAAPAPTPISVPIENTANAVQQPPTEYTPRRAAPELSSSLSAMRDLANSAARTAIDQHVRLHTSKRATQRLLGACLTVACSACLAVWAWRVQSLHAAAGACAGGAIGAYWTLAALRRLSGLKRLQRETEGSVAEPAVPAELLALPELHATDELPTLDTPNR